MICLIGGLNYRKNNYIILALLLYLYIFLCFGYMTGTDWRLYELKYYDSSTALDLAQYEIGFYVFYDYLHQLISDFWLAVGILKCIYLYSVYKITKELSTYWVVSLAILLSLSLMFMTINNPLRFMVANIFVNYALFLCVRGKYAYGCIVMMVAPLFHIMSIFSFLYILAFKMRNYVSNIKTIFIVVIFLSIVILSLLIGGVGEIVKQIGFVMSVLFESKDYVGYTDENADAVISFGAICKIFLSMFLIINRKKIIKEKNGYLIFSFSILYIFLNQILILIPTGFRLVIPIAPFYAISFAIIIFKSKYLVRYSVSFVFLYMTISMASRGYAYIPYSNSIPYILTKHKSYDKRDSYNMNEYKKRTGQEPDIE